MKYIRQFGIILIISFLGEILHELLPLPVPASIYGIVIMLFCLKTKVISLDSVKETGKFLIEIMPIMFIPAAVGLITVWDVIRPKCVSYIIITIVSTVVVMAVSGHITQMIIRRHGNTQKEHKE